jgi:hypothetical protein
MDLLRNLILTTNMLTDKPQMFMVQGGSTALWVCGKVGLMLILNSGKLALR